MCFSYFLILKTPSCFEKNKCVFPIYRIGDSKTLSCSEKRYLLHSPLLQNHRRNLLQLAATRLAASTPACARRRCSAPCRRRMSPCASAAPEPPPPRHCWNETSRYSLILQIFIKFVSASWLRPRSAYLHQSGLVFLDGLLGVLKGLNELEAVLLVVSLAGWGRGLCFVYSAHHCGGGGLTSWGNISIL